MRISDWSSDVCSSDLFIRAAPYLVVPGVNLLETPFNSGGYTAADMATAFRTYEDIGTMNTKTWSLFGNADAGLTEQLKLTVGLSNTEDKQDYVGCKRDYNGSMMPNVTLVHRFLRSN